ncbi:MAG: hypothetical protein NC338_05565 [Firmicutes bacterium]|nr:hypothetical protein [Bacillota bacterium]MCM1401412.1 hypothetical protein [Bacteroides sp.]MCM1477318.1 hypothetical protein [Bacteroides sp.]
MEPSSPQHTDPHGRLPFIRRITRLTRGSDLLVFLVCLGIATVFWLFLSLYEEVERDYDVPLAVENVPDSIVIVETLPASFNVVVQGKGVQFLKFLWHSVRPLKVNFNDFASSSGQFNIPRQKLDALFREYFGQGVKIVNLRPESIKATFTSNVGRRVAVDLVTDIKTNIQYVVSGPIKANIDSVMIYSANELPANLTSVSTYPLIRSGLKDTTEFVVKIKPIEGIRIIPDQVKVKVPVEPLISKKWTVPIEVMNQSSDSKLIIFPSAAEVSYLVPMSQYNHDLNVKLFVDFANINRNTQKVKVQSSAVSGIFRNFSFTPDSVEYIIETRQNDSLPALHAK